MRDPATGDYRPVVDYFAEAYGCQTFLPEATNLSAVNQPQKCFPPPMGHLIRGGKVDVGGLISEDTTWDADLITVTETVVVAADASLTIAANTRVEFAGYYRLLVHGRLWAVGEPDKRITFTATRDQESEGWDGLEFLNVPAANDFSRLEHCLLSFAVAKAGENVAERVFGGTSRPETGGAISIVGVNKLAITACVFTNNRADYGGAVYVGYGSSPVLAGNLFYNNTAVWQGSAVFNVYAYPKLVNNTIAGNECLAESAFHLCGAVDNFNGKVLLLNNTIRDNFTNHYSATQLVGNKDYYTHANNIAEYAGNDSNFDLDPLFLNEGENPYQLVAGSPCIDAGIDDLLLGALPGFDVAGDDRICNGQIDVGAYEFCGSASGSPQVLAIPVQPTLTCRPNPFNPRTRIIFDLPRDCLVNIEVYDLQGRRLRNIHQGMQAVGQHEVSWDGCDEFGRGLSSGTYLYRLIAGRNIVTRSMTLIR